MGERTMGIASLKRAVGFSRFVACGRSDTLAFLPHPPKQEFGRRREVHAQFPSPVRREATYPSGADAKSRRLKKEKGIPARKI